LIEESLAAVDRIETRLEPEADGTAPRGRTAPETKGLKIALYRTAAFRKELHLILIRLTLSGDALRR
jgi:hypothetical protein